VKRWSRISRKVATEAEVALAKFARPKSKFEPDGEKSLQLSEQFLVLITCRDEKQQSELLKAGESAKRELGFRKTTFIYREQIMPNATSCSGCSKKVLASPDGRMPPWCPHCGASLKAHSVPESLPPAAAPTPMGAAGFVPTVDAAPTESFFHVCIPGNSENHHRLYRIYITSSDLLVFAIGVGAVSMGEVLARTRPVQMPQGGMAGAWAAVQQSEDLKLADRIAELDAADETTLRQIAESGDRAFQVTPQDLKWMILDGPSLWYRWFNSIQHEAVWKFAHRTQGRWDFALPSLRDARRAAEWLPRLFHDLVKVKLSWGSRALVKAHLTETTR